MKKVALILFPVYLIVFIPIGLMFSYAITEGFLAGIVAGIIAAAFFTGACLLYIVYISLDKNFDKRMPDLEAGEEMVQRGAGSFEPEGKSLGGYLFLTNKKLYFESIGIIARPVRFAVILKEITHLEKENNGNVLILQIGEYKPAKFCVDGSMNWYEAICRLLQ